MKKYIFTLIVLLYASCVFVVNADNLESPSFRDTLKDSNNRIGFLKSFLDKKELNKFYELASELIEEFDQKKEDQLSPEDIAEFLWLRYLIASAPVIQLNENEDLDGLGYGENLDYKVKWRVLHCISSSILLNRSFTEEFKINQKEAVRIFMESYAVILSQFRQEVVVGFDAYYDDMKKNVEKDKSIIVSAEKTIYYFNKLNTKYVRNEYAKSNVNALEDSFLNILIKFFPNESSKVKMYLRKAGYENKEIPDLLDRTVGRVQKAAYLYNGFSKRRSM